MVEELRAELGRRLEGTCVQEAGTARLVFATDLSAADGVLVNEQEESFALYARRAPPPMDLLGPDLPSIGVEPAPASFDVVLVDGSTGSQYSLKGVTLALSQTHPGHLSLESDQLRFETEELLVGSRADVEISQFLSPEQAGKGAAVHLGTMSVNCTAALTPPPTPSSVLDDPLDPSAPEDMDQDFLR